MVPNSVYKAQHNLLLLAEEETFHIVDEITDLLSSWYCHSVYNWNTPNWDIADQLGYSSSSRLKPRQLNNDAFNVSKAISQYPGVGLFTLGSTPSKQTLAHLEHALRTANDTAWVAILTEQHFNNRELMALVATYCQDYISYPLYGVQEKLSDMLGHIAGMTQLRNCESSLSHTTRSLNPPFNMVGSSAPIKQLFTQIAKYAITDAPVQIFGESGTGKELVAKAIHQQSSRADKPFIAVNCGAIPENLLESELFGHIKGAFTGAIQNRDGRIAVADGGTLFLDEIGDLSLNQQVKILRFIQESTFEPVGSSRTQHADVRIITASHLDLQKAVQDQTFREDLYYRLNVLQLNVPPLRERNGDIELLANHYLAKFTAGKANAAKGFSVEAVQAMVLHKWPGNVRELINKVKKAAILCEGVLIDPNDLDLDSPATQTSVIVQLQDARDKAERDALGKALEETEFNISKTAELLGISRMTIYRLLEKHQIPY